MAPPDTSKVVISGGIRTITSFLSLLHPDAICHYMQYHWRQPTALPPPLVTAYLAQPRQDTAAYFHSYSFMTNSLLYIPACIGSLKISIKWEFPLDCDRSLTAFLFSCVTCAI